MRNILNTPEFNKFVSQSVFFILNISLLVLNLCQLIAGLVPFTEVPRNKWSRVDKLSTIKLL